MHMNENDMLVLNKHEALIVRLLQQEETVVAEQIRELRADLQMCVANGMERDAELVRAMLKKQSDRLMEVLEAAAFLAKMEDVLFSGGESNWLVV